MNQYYHTTFRLWKLLKPFHKDFYIQLFFIIAQQTTNVVSVFFAAKIIDLVIKKDFKSSMLFVIYIGLLTLLRIGISYVADTLSLKKLQYDIQHHLGKFSFKSIFKLNISQYLEDHSAIKMDVVSRGEHATEQIINTFILTILPVVTQVIFGIAAISYYSFSVASIVAVTLIVIVFWTYKFNDFLRPLLRKSIDNWTFQNRRRVETFQHLSLVKTNGIEEGYLTEYLKNRESYIDYTKSVMQYRVNHNHKRRIVMVSSKIVSNGLVIYFAFLGTITIGAIYAIWTWINDAYDNIMNLLTAMRQIPIQFVELEKYLDIIDKKANFDETGKTKFISGDIVFENVNFKYLALQEDVISNINLTIKEGQKTAFVGTSGSGKSTIIKILLRMYDYENGSIKINKNELKDIYVKELRQNIGYVEQHVELFDSSIRENILLGLTDKNIDEKVLSEIVHKSRIDQFFHRLTKGLDTQIGERGVKLSGGERQRIGIARALVKSPSILIFDEATASLDTENEKYIQEAIDDSSSGKTTIIIAHRLSTVQNADMIYVMHKGEIVGNGTHIELLNNNEYYQNLIKHQF